MLSHEITIALPTTDELPCSDDTPVDNEDQNFLPNVLLFLLCAIWALANGLVQWRRHGSISYYGVNSKVPVVPDGFLSVGVERKKGGKSRKSYAVWEENEVVPILTLEMVSQTPGGEYDEKHAIYTKLGVLYYVIYNPEYWRRDQHQPFEVYKLVDGNYQLQIGEPYWMPEVGLGIGRYQGVIGGISLELLSWYDKSRNRYLTSDEQAQLERTRAELERTRAELERTRAEHLAQYLRSLGIDPNNLPSDS